MKKGLLRGFGAKPKPMRTRQEIDNEYNHHALNLGHKVRVIEDLEGEVVQHKDRMIQLNLEGKALMAAENARAAGQAGNQDMSAALPSVPAPAAEPQVTA